MGKFQKENKNLSKFHCFRKNKKILKIYEKSLTSVIIVCYNDYVIESKSTPKGWHC